MTLQKALIASAVSARGPLCLDSLEPLFVLE